MKKFNEAFSYYKEENNSDKIFSHPFIKTKKNAENKEENSTCLCDVNNERLKIIKAIKDFKLDFIKRNNLLKETRLLKETCMVLLKSMEFKSRCLKKHIIAVSVYSGFLAESVNLISDEINKIEIGGLLHDIGKMSFPDYIFYKPGKLNELDLNEIKKHSLNGYSIIKSNLPGDCEEIAQIALYHHEKWNGTGYPNRLKGEEIPIGARIVSICDSFDSMIRKKYLGQKLKTIEETLTELEKNKDGQWDPGLVKQFINIISKDNYALYNHVKNFN